MQEEKWVLVPYYENYEISNYGRVRNIKTGKYLAQHDNGRGYLHVSLWKNNKGKREYVHRLVALAFIPNPEHKPQVDHIDTDRQNNYVENLRWATPSENNLNPNTRNKKLGKVINGTKIVKCDMEGNPLDSYESYRQAERKNGLANGVISRYIRKNYSQCGGYTWIIN